MITVNEVKGYLSIIHDYDDDKLQMILDGAIDEALRYCNVDKLDDVLVDGKAPKSFVMGVMLLCQGDYNLGVDDLSALRRAAETKLHPFRRKIGV